MELTYKILYFLDMKISKNLICNPKIMMVMLILGTETKTRQRLDLLQDQRCETQWEKQALTTMRECARRQAEICNIMAAVCRN